MTQEEPHEDPALLERYRRASAAEGAQPRPATRAAILDSARQVAAEQSRAPGLPFAARQGGIAHQRRFRLAAYGTLGVVLLAAVLVMPSYRQSSPRPGSVTFPDTPPMNAALSRTAPTAVPDAAARESTPAPLPSSPAAERSTADRTASPQSAAAAPNAAQVDDRYLAHAKTSQQFGSIVAQTRQSQRAMSVLRQDRSNEAVRAPAGAPAPLLLAVTQGDLAQTTRLLDQGASMRELDDAGRSALFLAVMQRRADLVRLLLERGADPTLVDRAGQSPLDFARQHHYDDLLSLLTPR